MIYYEQCKRFAAKICQEHGLEPNIDNIEFVMGNHYHEMIKTRKDIASINEDIAIIKNKK